MEKAIVIILISAVLFVGLSVFIRDIEKQPDPIEEILSPHIIEDTNYYNLPEEYHEEFPEESQEKSQEEQGEPQEEYKVEFQEESQEESKGESQEESQKESEKNDTQGDAIKEPQEEPQSESQEKSQETSGENSTSEMTTDTSSTASVTNELSKTGCDLYTVSFEIEGKSTTVNVLEVKPGTFQANIGLGDNCIGGIADMKMIADSNNAPIAITGGFFQAYAEPHEPWGTLIKDGNVIHVGDIGTTIGFTTGGSVKMDTIRIKIEGGTNGSYKWPDNWYAFGFNHTPDPDGNSVYIFTPERGSNIGFSYGTSVIVDNGRVKDIVNDKNVPIPQKGFVITFLGSEKYLLDRFKKGTIVTYKTAFTNQHGQTVNWDDVVTAIGAGPRLVTNGWCTVDPEGEGFREDKILIKSFNRTAIGVKEDGSILLVTTSSLTIQELASVMMTLGAKDAMNLDGGASSGLYYNGEYVTKPGRELSNVLVFRRLIHN